MSKDKVIPLSFNNASLPHTRHDIPGSFMDYETWTRQQPGTLAQCRGCSQWFKSSADRSFTGINDWVPVRWWHFADLARIADFEKGEENDNG